MEIHKNRMLGIISAKNLIFFSPPLPLPTYGLNTAGPLPNAPRAHGDALLQLRRRPSLTPPSPPRPQLAPHLDLQPGELKEDGEVAAVWSDGGGTRYSFGALALLYVASHFQCASYRGGGGDGG